VTNPLAAYNQYRMVRPAGITDAQWEAIIDPILAQFRDQGLIYPTNPILPVAIYDLRRQNFANELINGIDYNVNYRFDNIAGKWVVGVGGTQFLSFYQQIPGVPQAVQLLDTDYAVRTKLRGTVGWHMGDYGANLFLNYVGHYTNENFTPYQAVSSFTTVDLHLSWSPQMSGVFAGTQLTFDVTNLFDRDPPVYYTNNSNNGIPGFDPLVANAFGRILSVGLHKSW
jgi:iron complex outermembrane receptor protein